VIGSYALLFSVFHTSTFGKINETTPYPYAFAVRDFHALLLAGPPALHEKYATLQSRILENASFDRESTPRSLCTFESSGLN
jgi:hypothetical protein